MKLFATGLVLLYPPVAERELNLQPKMQGDDSVNMSQKQSVTHSSGCTQSRCNLSFTLALIAAMAVWMSASALAQNATPFVNAPLSPGQKTPGSTAFTLTVNGTGFISGATVYWNGNARTTTFVNSSRVTATINATDVATAGTAVVKVGNPAPGGGMSNPVYFQVVKGSYPIGYGKLEFSTDTSPQAAVSGDFNGDGIADLAVATGNNSVSMLLGKGDGTFPTHVEYPVPGHPIGIVAGDFNGDGKLDVATVDEFQSEITILLGNGDGTFQAHQEYATGNHPVSITAADLNGDGHLDIITADLNDNKVGVLLGNGDGTFKTHKDYATGNGPSDVAIGDFNGDGRLDLVVANNTDTTVAILLGNGDGSFQGPIGFPTATLPNSVVAGDFNNDGKLDLAVGTSNKSVSVLLGNGDGTFQNHKDYTIGANAQIVAAADVNADGKLDLISANYNDNTVSVLAGNGDGTFKGQSAFPTGAGPLGIAVGDFNNNGKLDIAVAASNANTVSVLTDNVITLSPNVFAFGTQTSGYVSSPKTVTLKNNGSMTYTIGTISWIGAYVSDFSIQSQTCGTTLAAGASCTYSIVFAPTASEQANGQMLITASNGTVLGIQLQGQGNIPIYLAPRTMTFTWQLINTVSAPKTDTFTNRSGVPITLTRIDLEGVNQDQFGLTFDCPLSPQTLAPGASCTSNVTYAPTFVGQASVTQVYYGNFTLVKQGLLISGESTAVKVTPTTLNFGTVSVGSSKTMNATFQNAGSTPLTLSSVSFSGSSAGGWTFASGTTCPTTGGGSVAANSTCTYSITFTPQITGGITAQLNIGDSDPTGPQVITLNGTGQ